MDISKEEMENLAKDIPNVLNFISNKEIVKIIIVPTKLTRDQKNLFNELLDSNLNNEDAFKDFERHVKMSK